MNLNLCIILIVLQVPMVKSLLAEEIEALIKEAGEIFNAPKPFHLDRIDVPDITDNHPSYSVAEKKGFHLADILGYMLAQDIRHCIAACHTYPNCKALNYIKSNQWCVLTKTASIHPASIWNKPDIGSVHVYFTEANGAVDEHKLKSSSSGSLALPGTTSTNGEVYRAFPWMIQINNCSAILMPKTTDFTQSSISSDLIIIPVNCLQHRPDGKRGTAILGSLNAIVPEHTEVYSEVHSIAIGGTKSVVIAKLTHSVGFNEFIRPIAMPNRANPSSPDKCKVVGWPNDITSTSLKSANLKVIDVDGIDIVERCLHFKDDEAEMLIYGSVLLCPEVANAYHPVWTFYGIKVSLKNCPSKFVSPFFNMHYLMPFLEMGVRVIPRPNEDDMLDPSAEIILQNGNDYSYPFAYKILPIDRDLALEDIQIKPNDYEESWGFHFADVINYTKADSKEDCMIACLVAVKPCWAVNYVSTNKWCVFLASAHSKDDQQYVKLWKHDNLSSIHIYFYSWKRNPPRHQPIKRGLGKELPIGLAPRTKIKGARITGGYISTPLTHPWMARIRDHCGGVLIESPTDNADKKFRSDLVLTAAHCVNINDNYNSRGSPIPLWSLRIRLGVHRQDILEIAQDLNIAKKVITHAHYDSRNAANDIALIQLKSPVDFTDFIGPIRLPEKHAEVPESQVCKAMGWGRENIGLSASDTLKEVKLQVTNTCRQIDTEQASLEKGLIFCTKPVESEDDNICTGDSGGPFLCSQIFANGTSLSTLYGITSYGQSDEKCNNGFAAFTKVSSFIEWLKGAELKLKDQADDTSEYFA